MGIIMYLNLDKKQGRNTPNNKKKNKKERKLPYGTWNMQAEAIKKKKKIFVI